jgi:hypothetical protein
LLFLPNLSLLCWFWLQIRVQLFEISYGFTSHYTSGVSN